MKSGWISRLIRLPGIFALVGSTLLGSSAPAATVSICRIQGSGFESAKQGDRVTTTGVVFADMDTGAMRGFFLQDEGCDRHPETSDGLFIYLGVRTEVVAVGDRVQVTGIVEEEYGRTQLSIATGDVLVLAPNNPLPAAHELAPPFDPEAARRYFESLEGMHVGLASGQVVGPTDARGRTWLVRADLAIERVFYDDPLGVGEIICVGEDGQFEISPPVATGDTLSGISGGLDYLLGDYCVRLDAAPVQIPGVHPPPPPVANQSGLTAATFNLNELFDMQDDPATDDTVLGRTEYNRRLYKRALAIHTALGEPDILGLQEVENRQVLDALVHDPDVLRSDYRTAWADGPDRRGLDVALLYRADRLWAAEIHSFQGCTSLIDGMGPDGNGDVLVPANSITCDTNGDGAADGNRLFSRPPLAVRLVRMDLPGELWVIVCHFKSKLEDTATIAYTQPRRTQEAQFVAMLANGLRAYHPAAELIVLGDLNDHIGSLPLQTLAQSGLVDITQNIPPQTRYSYNYLGVSQKLDYILWHPSWSFVPWAVTPAHINADFPDALQMDTYTLHRSSDHDPLWARFGRVTAWTWLPLMLRSP